ncbi:hypothetical protein NEAUS05_2060 [Nematocida ausubeli]|nr:hypothetical protein NEAUS06_1846 [Nematocida ausubeli]KAI5150161.1 hypothetical protein NEAUS05_2060 [Nematocida ausubeli]
MLILHLLAYATKTKERVQVITGSILALLSITTLYLFSKIALQEIPCYSDQLIKHAEYSVKCTESKVAPVQEYRDSEYDEYNSILLTGSSSSAGLIARVHKTAQEMKNRTKGYDIKIGKCSLADMQKYFLVLEIEESDNTLLYIINQGWQVNSDILSIFCDRLYTAPMTGVAESALVNLTFNRLFLKISEDGLESVLAILHNIHNLYSHSLGVYFYWVVDDRAIFLSSNVLLVITIAVFLIFLEFATMGSFSIQPVQFKTAVHALMAQQLVFMDISEISYFEMFMVYSVLIPLNFPLAILLGSFRIFLFFCTMIGCLRDQDAFLGTFRLLYETGRARTDRKVLSASFTTHRHSEGKQIP